MEQRPLHQVRLAQQKGRYHAWVRLINLAHIILIHPDILCRSRKIHCKSIQVLGESKATQLTKQALQG
jgi:hypothetical protein